MSGATSTSTWCRRQGRTERRSGRTSTRGSVLLMNQGYLPPPELRAERARVIAASGVVAGGDGATACSAPELRRGGGEGGAGGGAAGTPAGAGVGAGSGSGSGASIVSGAAAAAPADASARASCTADRSR